MRLRVVLLLVGMLLVGSGVLTAYATSETVSDAMVAQEGEQAFLGIAVRQTDQGVMVSQVFPGSPAEAMGIRAGDFIVALGDEPIEEVERLLDIINNRSPGDVMTLTIRRGDEVFVLDVVLVESPLEPGPSIPRQRPGRVEPEPFQLGVAYRSLTPEIADSEDLSVEEGAWVREVFPGTPAADSSIEVGDIIVAVDGDVVDIEHTLSDRLYAYEREDRVILTVIRGDETLEIGVVVAADHPNKQPGRFQPVAPHPPIEPFYPPDVDAVPMPPEGVFGPDFGIHRFICWTVDGFEFQVILTIPPSEGNEFLPFAGTEIACEPMPPFEFIPVEPGSPDF